MSVLSKALGAAGVGYEIYRIYVQESPPKARPNPAKVTFQPIDGAALAITPDAEIRALQSYDKPVGAFGFGALMDEQIRCACWYWTGQTYAQRGFWPLGANDAKLVQIVTATDYQGRGLATALIEWSSAQMADAGFSRRYARVWHSNTGSIRAFEKAGWREHAFVVTVTVPWSRWFLRFEKIMGKGPTIALKEPRTEGTD